MRNFIESLARDESGVTAVEYAILAGVVVAILVGAGMTFSTALEGAFNRLGLKLDDVAK